MQVGNAIEQITMLDKSSDGQLTRVVVYKKKGSRGKKNSRPLRMLERMMRRVARGQAEVANDYLDRHKKSNKKKKNGWLRDLGNNVFKATKRGRKAMKDSDDD